MAKKPLAVIFDIDGTLAQITEEQDAFAVAGDWAAYHANISTATPIQSVVMCTRKFRELNCTNIALTARPEQYRPETALWLVRHAVAIDLMYMREEADFRHGVEVKTEHLRTIKQDFQVLVAFEDCGEICRMFERNGVDVIKIDNHLNREHINDHPMDKTRRHIETSRCTV